MGVGWHGGKGNTTGLTMDGGYAECMVANEDGAILIPDELSSVEAAPLLCAGETVFSALRDSSAKLGDLVAVSGIGGLGHLAIQYASKAGFEVAALSHGSRKKELAQKLGCHHYIDTSTSDPTEELQKLGGAHVVIATAPSPSALAPLPGCLKPGGSCSWMQEPYTACWSNCAPSPTSPSACWRSSPPPINAAPRRRLAAATRRSGTRPFVASCRGQRDADGLDRPNRKRPRSFREGKRIRRQAHDAAASHFAPERRQLWRHIRARHRVKRVEVAHIVRLG